MADMENFSKYFDFCLTQEQQNVVVDILDFFKSEEQVYILKGYAGTGKTSLIKGIIKYMTEIKRPYSLMASTGRAAKILSEKTGRKASTIHSKIYRLMVIDLEKESYNSHRKGQGKYRNIRIVFSLGNNSDKEKTVYFIDESSMISNHKVINTHLNFGTGMLLTDLLQFAGKRKIVFIGDTIQLPPVNTRFSAALNKPYIEESFGIKVRESELVTIKRYQHNTGIYQNATKIRKIVQSGRFPFLSIRASDLRDSFVYSNERNIVEKYTQTIHRIGIDNTIFLCYSNKMASVINNIVRGLMFKQKRIEPLNQGEALMVIKNNYLYDLFNGDFIFFEKAGITVKKAGFEFIKVEFRVNETELGSRIVSAFIIKDLLLSSNRDLALEEEDRLMKNFYGRISHLADELYPILLKSSDNPGEVKKELHEKYKTEYYDPEVPPIVFNKMPTKNALKKALIIANIQRDPFLNALRVKYGYAITCHKAQGGEWKEVFILFEKSMFYMEKENQYRWAYTAISRASEKVHYLENMCIY